MTSEYTLYECSWCKYKFPANLKGGHACSLDMKVREIAREEIRDHENLLHPLKAKPASQQAGADGSTADERKIDRLIDDRDSLREKLTAAEGALDEIWDMFTDSVNGGLRYQLGSDVLVRLAAALRRTGRLGSTSSCHEGSR